MIKFKPGDTVRLKSGGALLTVGSIRAGVAKVYWFTLNDSQVNAANAPVAILNLVVAAEIIPVVLRKKRKPKAKTKKRTYKLKTR